LVPELRIRRLNQRPLRPDGRWVVYWMVAARRTTSNFALQRAVELAESFDRPLIVLEALECDYPWASDRLHRFIIEGMTDQLAQIRGSAAYYYPYVEPEPGAGRDLLAALTDGSCAVVTDDYPGFFIPQIISAAARRIEVAVEAVDANGLLPVWAVERAYPTAHSFRRFLQRELPVHLADLPDVEPLRTAAIPKLPGLPDDVLRRWTPASEGLLNGEADAIVDLPIDHAVPPVARRGGETAAREQLDDFVARGLRQYEQRNHPDARATSGLSPYLHFGHISAHEVFDAVARSERWTPGGISDDVRGRRVGWWGMSAPAEAFLDQLVTWRELGYNTAVHHANHASFDALPSWARDTLEAHAGDAREYVYSIEELEAAETHDPIWNAAQRELLQDGSIHGYLRMLWGKKILEWTESPRAALDVMLELNNRYALDGRDPNSYSGIFWVLGRYDRAWGPERPVFGKIRYMSSDQAKRKLRLREYLDRFSTGPPEGSGRGLGNRL